jgi:hypothetical protein
MKDKGKGVTFDSCLFIIPLFLLSAGLIICPNLIRRFLWPFKQPLAHQAQLQVFIGSGIIDWHALAAAMPNFRPLAWRLAQPQRVFPAVSRKVRLGSGSTTPGI